MSLHLRILLAFLVLGLFMFGMFALEEISLPFMTKEVQAPVTGVLLDLVFTKADFRYGPQSGRPYYDPQAIDPGRNASAGDLWYMMYIDLNGTPVGGNPDIRRLGVLKVNYNFTNLAGSAAFHTYGFRPDSSQTRTNRQDGWNRCGYLVYGMAEPGQTMPATTVLSPSALHEYRVTIANVRGENSNDFSAATRTLRFDRAGSGLDALHITRDLSVLKGDVTETFAQQGSFFVTATGGNPGTDLLLLVAVNRAQPEGFSLSVRSEFVEVA
jgi:hypothetical protein